MTGDLSKSGRSDPSFEPLMRSLAIELAIYAPLVALYFFIVLRLAWGFLSRLYVESPVEYSIVALLIIIGQGVLLEALTSWLLRRIGLRQ
jgi:hypothetical protein